MRTIFLFALLAGLSASAQYIPSAEVFQVYTPLPHHWFNLTSSTDLEIVQSRGEGQESLKNFFNDPKEKQHLVFTSKGLCSLEEKYDQKGKLILKVVRDINDKNLLISESVYSSFPGQELALKTVRKFEYRFDNKGRVTERVEKTQNIEGDQITNHTYFLSISYGDKTRSISEYERNDKTGVLNLLTQTNMWSDKACESHFPNIKKLVFDEGRKDSTVVKNATWHEWTEVCGIPAKLYQQSGEISSGGITYKVSFEKAPSKTQLQYTDAKGQIVFKEVLTYNEQNALLDKQQFFASEPSQGLNQAGYWHWDYRKNNNKLTEIIYEQGMDPKSKLALVKFEFRY